MPLSVKTLHSKIEERETNAIYYLLRKFRILKETINIQEDLTITGKYGKYKWTTSTGKLDITDCEPTTNYKIIFSILNISTKQIRTVEANSNVSSSNTASITIPTLQSNEILQTNVNVEITYPQYITQNPYQITVTADKPVIQADETTTFTAELKYNNTAVSGKTLNYKLLHGSTVLDSGSDTTNSQGKITFEYEGTAIGEVDLVVSYGMLLQETYELYDCISYDSGVTGSATDTYFKSNSAYVTKTITDTGTVFACTHPSNSQYFFIIMPNTSPTTMNEATMFPTGNYIVEGDIVDFTGECELQIRGENGTNLIRRKLNQLSNNTNFHVRIEINGNTASYYVDGSSTPTYTNTNDLGNVFGIRFSLLPSKEVKVKNIKVYPV